MNKSVMLLAIADAAGGRSLASIISILSRGPASVPVPVPVPPAADANRCPTSFSGPSSIACSSASTNKYGKDGSTTTAAAAVTPSTASSPNNRSPGRTVRCVAVSTGVGEAVKEMHGLPSHPSPSLSHRIGLNPESCNSFGTAAWKALACTLVPNARTTSRSVNPSNSPTKYEENRFFIET